MKSLIGYIILSMLFITCANQQAGENSELPAVSATSLTTVYPEKSVVDRDITFRDARLFYMHHTDTEFQEFPTYRSVAAWEARKDYLRKQVLVASGLWPLPEKTPLTPNVSGRIERSDYTVEKVSLQTYPDFYLAGNLYRPKGKTGPFPAILTPHGHWERGRIHDSALGSIPARSINFANQGYIVLAYDMVGYGDTRQVPHSFASDSLSQFWGINLFGLQLWNSMRALDFLVSLPDVDTSRIAITGASGGGTQTFALTAALDNQILKVSAPVNMISTVMQGGCLCENAPELRINAFNVELGAMMAPRPLFMVSNTHDWTVNTPQREFPMIQSIYQLYNAGDHLDYAYFDYPHNYNRASREAVYKWFGNWMLDLDNPEELHEESFEPIADADLLVFLKKAVTDREVTFQDLPADQYSLPPGAERMNEATLKQYMINTSRQRVEDDWPADRASLQAFRDIYGTAYEHTLSADQPVEIAVHQEGQYQGNGFRTTNLMVSRMEKRDWIPAVYYEPTQEARTADVIVSPGGKAELVESDGVTPVELVRELLANGHSVLAIDAFKTGEHVLIEGTQTQRDEHFQYFTTFNKTDAQERAQDIITAARYLRAHQMIPQVNIIGLKEAGLWAIMAGGTTRDVHKIAALEVEVPATDEQAMATEFIPGFLRIGGMNTAAALSAPTPLLINSGQSNQGNLNTAGIQKIYDLAGASGAFQLRQNALSGRDVVSWLEE